jgi:hypothetical protein
MNFNIVTFALAKGYAAVTGAHKETHGGTDPALSVYNHRRSVFAANRGENPRMASRATGSAGVAIDKKNLSGAIWFADDYATEYQAVEENLIHVRGGGNIYFADLVLGIPQLIAAVPVGVWSMKEEEVSSYLSMGSVLASGSSPGIAYQEAVVALKKLRA